MTDVSPEIDLMIHRSLLKTTETRLARYRGWIAGGGWWAIKGAGKLRREERRHAEILRRIKALEATVARQGALPGQGGSGPQGGPSTPPTRHSVGPLNSRG